MRNAAKAWRLILGAVVITVSLSACAPNPTEGGLLELGADAYGAYSEKDSHQFNAALDDLTGSVRAFADSSPEEYRSASADLSASVEGYASAVATTTFPAVADDGLPSGSQADALVDSSRYFVQTMDDLVEIVDACGMDSTMWTASCASAGQGIAQRMSAADSDFTADLNTVLKARGS